MFQLNLSVYQGPLDLLLHLIERRELDITAVSLAEVADQFLDHMRSASQVDTETLAEFIRIGARLLYIKSRALLPPPEQSEEEKAAEDGESLAQMLIEYRRFKGAASILRQLEGQGHRVYTRSAPAPGLTLPTGLADITLEHLLHLFHQVTSRQVEAVQPVVIEREETSVEQKIAEIQQAVQTAGQVRFQALVSEGGRRLDVIVTFLALLELLKVGRVTVRQETLFGDIVIAPAAPTPRRRRP